MATIKSYTDLEQSKKLEEILPLESADLKWFFWEGEDPDAPRTPSFGYRKSVAESYKDTYAIYLPCWSLTALLSVIPNYKLSSEHNYHTCAAETSFGKVAVAWFDNPIDACYELILKLHELNLL